MGLQASCGKNGGGKMIKSTTSTKAAMLLALALANTSGAAGDWDNARFVNPFIGTASGGHTYPGATVPFGLVQVSPDTGNVGWNYCSGYQYEDSEIIGFSHTHMSGSGCPDLGDILLMPFTGAVQQPQYKSQFSHLDETAWPGYYAVELKDFGIKAELTVSQRCAFHRYSFDNAKDGHVLLDLQAGLVGSEKAIDEHVIRSKVHFDDAQTVSGCVITSGWGGKRTVCFVLQFKNPPSSVTWIKGEKETRNQRLVLNFSSESNLVINAKIGLSTVDIDGARANLAAEIPGWDFYDVAKKAYALWNERLSKIEVRGTRKELETFYSGLYHTMVSPNDIADVDGRYRGPDNQVHVADNNAYYSSLSLWDIHRAVIPLYTIIYPDVIPAIADTMLRHFDVTGSLPMWPLWGQETHCMIGNPSIPVLVDAYLKGLLPTSEAERVFEAIKITSTVNHPKSNWDEYNRYGYLPSDIVREEAVSRTLESAFDDWCVAQMAKTMGKTNDEAVFNRRATFYRNLFDPSSGLMRGKNSDGTWVTPFDTLIYSHAGDAGGDYTEANAWQYTWHVQQNPDDLIHLMGGDKKFVEKLDRLFSLPPIVNGANTVDITGLIGQYVHGNEPCHHIAYLYSYAGMPWKTQERVHQITTTLYNNTAAGIPGNDDCGQMSAWYLFSVMGFYPVNPDSGIYVFGSPALNKVSLNVGDGKRFVVETVRSSTKDIYIDHVEYNGKPYAYSYISHEEILSGGELKFYMKPTPNYTFGKTANTRPVTPNSPLKNGLFSESE
jgi:predicted alpha-1,2-mannosidase